MPLGYEISNVPSRFPKRSNENYLVHCAYYETGNFFTFKIVYPMYVGARQKVNQKKNLSPIRLQSGIGTRFGGYTSLKSLN